MVQIKRKIAKHEIMHVFIDSNDDLVLQMIKANFEPDINKSISEAIERLSPGSIFGEARFILMVM